MVFILLQIEQVLSIVIALAVTQTDTQRAKPQFPTKWTQQKQNTATDNGQTKQCQGNRKPRADGLLAKRYCIVKLQSNRQGIQTPLDPSLPSLMIAFRNKSISLPLSLVHLYF